jgi:hypothetical protein
MPSIGVTFFEYEGPTPQTTPETSAVVPAFNLAEDLDLLEDAASLGLELASDDEFAQFDRLAAQRLYISQAKQSCMAVFSATGFEAAAVTAFGMSFAGSAPQAPPRDGHLRPPVRLPRPPPPLRPHPHRRVGQRTGGVASKRVTDQMKGAAPAR